VQTEQRAAKQLEDDNIYDVSGREQERRRTWREEQVTREQAALTSARVKEKLWEIKKLDYLAELYQLYSFVYY
jgi:hypothetical protein